LNCDEPADAHEPLQRGEFVRITAHGQTKAAFIALASSNGRSLILLFDGGLFWPGTEGAYAGSMPVLLTDDGRWTELINGREIAMERLDPSVSAPEKERAVTADDHGTQIAQSVTASVGKLVDLGWAVGVLDADGVFHRTCKGCGESVASPVDDRGNVAPVAVRHRNDCPELRKLRAL
jgi:hypothetical protein